MSDELKLVNLQLGSWRQIRNLDIRFHPRLTILTGSNGAGKSTVLNLISRHFGWHLPFVSAPEFQRRAGLVQYFTGLWRSMRTRPDSDQVVIGSFRYSDGSSARITVPESVSSTFQVLFREQRSLRGVHIPSHRPVSTYQQVESIPTVPRASGAVFTQYSSQIQDRLQGGGGGRSSHYLIKETLISWATFGVGNHVVQENPLYRSLFEGFQDTLRTVLPPKIGFRRLSIRIPEVVLETASGDFSLDAVSGGVSAIVDVAWQLFVYANDSKSSFVVTFDEPENHLHPELQQTLLPNLLRAFPNVQFVVATHNPFIVGSVDDSSVYVLDFDSSDHRVSSSFLDRINKAASANEILRDVLGVPHTIPLWAAQQLAEVVADFQNGPLTQESLTSLRRRLSELGLAEHVPDTVSQLVERQPK